MRYAPPSVRVNERTGSDAAVWCEGGVELVRLLRDTFGKEDVIVRSPYHIQVRKQSQRHNIWIDASQVVKYRLADQAGRALVATTPQQLLGAIRGHDHASSDLVNMRKALELSDLIISAKSALPLCGVSRAVFVDAGIKNDRAQIGVVQVGIEADGEHVRAESHPCDAKTSDAAEEAAIEYASTWAAKETLIFSDNRSAVERARKRHGDRIRWVPRGQNRVADRLANLRGKAKKKRRGKRKRKSTPKQ